MALSDTSKTLISIKKLVGKAHTSNDKDVANEALRVLKNPDIKVDEKFPTQHGG